MAFKSTTNQSHLRLVREVKAIGGNVTASASREQMGYSFDALKTYVPQMIELWVDSASNQVFLDWEVKEQIQKVKDEISEYGNNPEGLLLEVVHLVGYSGALANALLASEGLLNRLDSSILEEFVAVSLRLGISCMMRNDGKMGVPDGLGNRSRRIGLGD